MKFEWLGIQRAVEKKKMFVGTALLVDEPVPKLERRFTGIGQNRRCQLHMANCQTKTEKVNTPKSAEQCQSCDISICREHSMRVCHYSLRLDFETKS